MDIGTLLLILSITTLALAYILQPLLGRRQPDRDTLIAAWLREVADTSAQQGSQTCPHCQAPVRPGDRFCPSCGTRLKED
jgi:predicted amidophosphoribosyltransferase